MNEEDRVSRAGKLISMVVSGSLYGVDPCYYDREQMEEVLSGHELQAPLEERWSNVQLDPQRVLPA